jgi:hypothetical protein
VPEPEASETGLRHPGDIHGSTVESANAQPPNYVPVNGGTALRSRLAGARARFAALGAEHGRIIRQKLR